eukprot:2600383-Heterocapsa_arctica.AAC.1
MDERQDRIPNLMLEVAQGEGRPRGSHSLHGFGGLADILETALVENVILQVDVVLCGDDAGLVGRARGVLRLIVLLAQEGDVQ